jgi:hypothetical protein
MTGDYANTYTQHHTYTQFYPLYTLAVKSTTILSTITNTDCHYNCCRPSSTVARRKSCSTRVASGGWRMAMQSTSSGMSLMT